MCPAWFQPIRNLISNAVKFTEIGGIRISLQPAPGIVGSIELSVQDSGIGIAPEFQEQLFEPFSQADSGTTRVLGGTGLGLSIVKRLITLMNGRVFVESQLGMGSRFTVVLPLQASSESLPVVAAASGAPLRAPLIENRSYSVLLAEDNPINQLLVKTILENAGLNPIIVDNGERAVSVASSRTFDLILMDCRMPKLDGYDATRRIRALPEGRATVPIIALTANALLTDRELCREAGMDDFVSKPFEPRELIEKCLFWIHTGSQFNRATRYCSTAAALNVD
jgi:CheY-like chemotaxis protein